MARHPSDGWRPLRGVGRLIRHEPLATLLLVALLALAGWLLGHLLHDAGWLPPLRPGVWR